MRDPEAVMVGTSADIPPFIVKYFCHTVTHCTTFTLHTFCCHFQFFWLLLVYLHLVRVSVPSNKNTFMIPLSLIICNLIYPRILNYSFVYPFRIESYFLNTSRSNVHFINVLFNF
jgi:hypothetical protein